MSVYVDDMYLSPAGGFGRMKMSHMVADTREELDAMADKIGVARKWIQYPGHHQEHYDIAKSMREKALSLGAIAITWRQCSFMCRRRLEEGTLGDPSEAEVWRKALSAKIQANAGRSALEGET